MWGTVLKGDLLGETREEDKFHTKEQLKEYLMSEIEKQGENVVIRNLDVSLIEDLRGLFYVIGNGVKTLDVSGWNTSNVKNMSSIFYGCYNFKSLDLSGWKTSNVKDMAWMFGDCKNLESLDVSGWDTSNVKDMRWMFCDCYSLKSLDLSSWDTSNAKDMSSLFYDCNSLKDLDLSGWDTSNVKSMNDMFYSCPAPYRVLYDNKLIKK